MAVYAYVRVSTDRQADEGESLRVQERTIGGYAMMHGMTVDRTFVERGVSGAKPIGQRPEGAKLLAILQAGDVGDSREAVPAVSECAGCARGACPIHKAPVSACT
jgi:DNA invertase Pin-like site-specific DNA recombinase